jgi:hypothetical protein
LTDGKRSFSRSDWEIVRGSGVIGEIVRRRKK